MVDRYARMPYVLLLFGLFVVVLAVNATCTGEAWAGWGRVVCRDNEPKEFWEVVVIQFVGGVFLIGYFFYLIFWP